MTCDPCLESDTLYRLARASNTARAAARGPVPLAKRQIRRRVYRREGSLSREIVPVDRAVMRSPALDRVEVVARDLSRVERMLREAVDAARTDGATWAEIGDALGVTRQAAHERFSKATISDAGEDEYE